VSPGIECHTHDFIKTGQTDSKFGFNIEEVADAVTRIRKEFPHLNLKGFHAHIGSQIFAPESYFETGIRMIEIIADIAKQTGFMATELDLGGGVGVAYNSGDNPPSVYEAMEQLIAGVNHGCERHNIPHPLIYVEPGRSLVANAGVTLYKVGTFKNVPGIRTYMAIDGGMGDNPRPAMYGAEYTFAAANKMTEPTMEKYTIAGRYCESGDILSKDIVLPKMSAGDILAAFATGAYNAAMFLDYNRVGKPAIVLASDGKAEIISRRHTYEDLAQYDQIPERLK
jgi:diaminopimelate decarboxylase